MESGEHTPLKAKYNSAVAQLYRFDDLWRDCHKHSRNKEFLKWNLDLDAIWRELSEDTKEEVDNDFNRINVEIAKLEPYMIITKDKFSTPNTNHLSKLAQIYKLLHNKEIFLRRVMNQQGKGVAYDEDDDHVE